MAFFRRVEIITPSSFSVFFSNGIVNVNDYPPRPHRKATAPTCPKSHLKSTMGNPINTTDFERGQVVLVWIFKSASLLSMIGSSYVIYSLIGTKQKRRENIYKPKKTFQRLLLALSISDIVSSFALFLGTWMIPKEKPEGAHTIGYNDLVEDLIEINEENGLNLSSIYSTLWSKLFPYASGNAATCTLQGFLIQLGLCASVLLTGSIALQYVLAVKYQLIESKMLQVEKILFGLSIVIPVTTAIVASALKQMNPTTAGFCWIQESPWMCEFEDGWQKDPQGSPFRPRLIQFCSDHPNRRGQGAFWFRMFFALIWIAIVALVVIVSMILLYMAVRTQEQRAARWSDAAREGRDQIRVIKKAMCFIGAYLVVWIPVMIATFFDLNYDDQIAAAFLPIQGVLNALIHSNIIQETWKYAITNNIKKARGKLRFSSPQTTSPASSMTASPSNTQKQFIIESSETDLQQQQQQQNESSIRRNIDVPKV